MMCSSPDFLYFLLNPKLPTFPRILRGWSSRRWQGLGCAGGAQLRESPILLPVGFEGAQGICCPNGAFAGARRTGGAGGCCAQRREEGRGVEMESKKQR